MSFTLDTAGLARQLSALRERTRRGGSSMVRYWSRRLVRELAWQMPMAGSEFSHRGRLRAGWWPAANALNVVNIGTRQPNRNEGWVTVNLVGDNPSVTMANAVPFMAFVPGYPAFAQKAVNVVTATARKELEAAMRTAINV